MSQKTVSEELFQQYMGVSQSRDGGTPEATHAPLVGEVE
jgi:hypothetical protein